MLANWAHFATTSAFRKNSLCRCCCMPAAHCNKSRDSVDLPKNFSLHRKLSSVQVDTQYPISVFPFVLLKLRQSTYITDFDNFSQTCYGESKLQKMLYFRSSLNYCSIWRKKKSIMNVCTLCAAYRQLLCELLDKCLLVSELRDAHIVRHFFRLQFSGAESWMTVWVLRGSLFTQFLRMTISWKHISRGRVATRLRCGGIFNYHFIANLSQSLTMT